MKKRLLSLALAVALVCALLPTAALAAEKAAEDFVIDDNGVLTKYCGPGGDVVIPDGVTDIGEAAFEECTGLTSVTIPSSMTSIGMCAFAYTGLTSVTIPSSVTHIGHGAFACCDSLTSVTIGNGTFIGQYAFMNCTSLTSVTIGGGALPDREGEAGIAQGAFQSCTSLTSVTIGSGVTGIWDIAFYDCASLTSVTIPDSLTHIEESVFACCTGLTDVYYGGTEAQWKNISISRDNAPLETATIHCQGDGSIIDPNSASRLDLAPSETPAPSVEPQPSQTPMPSVEPSPAPIETPIPATGTAYASTQTVMVDGKPVNFNAYALKDANGNDTNYIKLRDVADVLNGSAAQFQVGWDGSIAITTGQSYTKNGTEMVQNFSGNQSYTVSTSPVTVNGAPTNLEAITLTDASGGGYTYFKLRDLGAALGFNVSWNAQTGITIDPNTPYNPAD